MQYIRKFDETYSDDKHIPMTLHHVMPHFVTNRWDTIQNHTLGRCAARYLLRRPQPENPQLPRAARDHLPTLGCVRREAAVRKGGERATAGNLNLDLHVYFLRTNCYNL